MTSIGKISVLTPTATAPTEVERGIEALLHDSITLGMQAQIAENNDFSNTLARASVIASILYIEACANCMLDSLMLTPRFAKEVDRLPTDAKLDLFLRLKYKNKSLDRGVAEYQGFVELKRFRDAFAHPKAQKYEWIEWSEESSACTSPLTDLLRLPTIPTFCGPETASIAIQATHSFMGYFFLKLCRMRPTQVAYLLFSRDVVPETKPKFIPYWHRSIHSWLAREKIDLSYMRIGKL